MASGCTNGSGGNSGLFQKLTPDTQVQYTGQAIPQLNICNGDLLSEVEATILQQILNFQQGIGISFSDIDLTTCECFHEKVGCCGAASCQTLDCILQAYLECMCSMYADIQVLKTEVSEMYDGPYNTQCLSGVTDASKLPDIIKEMIKELCAAEATITALQTQITNLSTGLPTTIGNFMSGALQSCQSQLVENSSGSSYTATFKGFAPIGTITAFAGNLGDFDSNGLGKPNSEVCGWAIADGRNGTQNMKGVYPLGTTDMISSLPVVGAGSYPATSVGGKYSVALTTTNIPTMSVSGSVTGIVANFPFFKVSRKHAQTGDNTMGYQGDGSGTSTADGIPNGSINADISGGTLSASVGGAGTAHENMPPYRALYFIQRIA